MKMERTIFTWLLFIALLVGCEKREPLPFGEFEVYASLSTQYLHVGDPVTLTLSAHHPAGSRISFPSLGTDRNVVVQSRSVHTEPLSAEVLQTEELYQLTSFRIGDWTLTTNPVVCIFSDDREKEKRLPELVLQVQSTLNETNATQLSDIQGIVRPPVRIPRWLWVLALVLALALVAGLVTLLLVKKKHPVFGVTPSEPPHITAQKALEALREEPWVPEPFFVKLSLILRTYLETRFHLNAPDLTTEELAGKLKNDAQLNPHDRQTLREFFAQADLVKFARAGAEQEVMQVAFHTVELFVEQTQKVEDVSIESPARPRVATKNG